MRYRVEIWIAAHDDRGPYATIKSVTLGSALSVALFCASIEILADLAGDPRQLPRVADISPLH